ncbi:hypothetical protein B7463_g8341, partial [Scytalidium lignicola]
MSQEQTYRLISDDNNDAEGFSGDLEESVEVSKEGSDDNPEEGSSEERSEEEQEDSSENLNVENTDIQDRVLEEVVIPLKQMVQSLAGSAVGESSRAAGEKPVLSLPVIKEVEKPPRELSLKLDPEPELEAEEDLELMALQREVKVAKPDFFTGNQRKLKPYLTQVGTYFTLNNHVMPEDKQKML